MTPRSSAISAQLPELGRRGVEHRAAGAALPVARQRVARRRGHRPVGDEAAEVVDAGEVVEVEGAPQALDPPAVAAPLQRRPVVERVAPQLALVGERVGRRAGDGAGLEELRVGAVVGAAGRDVDRDVADQLHAAVERVAAQRGPLAVEADLVGERSAAAERDPVVDPRGVALAEVELLAPSTPPRAAPRAARATPRRPTWPCRASRSGRAARAAASATTTGPRRAASRRTRRLPRPIAPSGGRSDATARRWNEGVSSGVHVGYSVPGCPQLSAPKLRLESASARSRRSSMRAATRPSAVSGTR